MDAERRRSRFQPTIRNQLSLVARMVGMTFKNRERTINLLEQHDPRQFMRQRHFPKRNRLLGGVSNFSTPPTRPADGEDKWQRIAVLIVSQKPRELLGGELLASRIHQYKSWLGAAL